MCVCVCVRRVLYVSVGGAVYVYVCLCSINSLKYRDYFPIQYHLKQKNRIYSVRYKLELCM